MTNNPTPRRGEIWEANTGAKRHWVLIVSLDARNSSDRINSVLIVPFSSSGLEGPTVIKLEPGETGAPGTSYLKAHFITTLPKSDLAKRTSRSLTDNRMREVVNLIRRAIDPEAPYK